MTKEKQEQLMLVVVTFAALGLAGYHLVIKPGIANLNEANTKITTIRDSIVSMKSNISDINNLSEKCKGLTTTLSNEEARLVGNGKYNAFLAMISSCGTNAGMPAAQQQTLSDVSAVKRGTCYAESWVTMVYRPRYHSFGKWLAAIEANPYVRIVNFSVNSMEADEGYHMTSDLIIGFLVKQGEK